MYISFLQFMIINKIIKCFLNNNKFNIKILITNYLIFDITI